MPKPKTFKEGITTFADRAARYADYVKHIDTRRFTTGLGEIDKAIRGVAPGEVLDIIAYSGTFKSALLQNLLMKSGAKTKKFQVMFSMEMPVEKCFERELQISNGVSGRTVEHHFKNETAGNIQREAYAMGGEQLLIVEEGRLNIERMINYVHMAQTVHGEVGCVGIDYLGLMKSEGKSLLEKTAELSFGIKEMAKALNLPVILLGQVSRSYAASKGVEIETDAAKGGGDIEAGADYMLGMYLHEGDVIMRILKNRNGPSGQSFKVALDKNSLTFLGVTDWEPPKPQRNRKDADF